VPHLCELYADIYLTTEEKARKNFSRAERKRLSVAFYSHCLYCVLPHASPRNLYTVNKVAMGQVFLLVLLFFVLGNNKPKVCTERYLISTLYFLIVIFVKMIYLMQQSRKAWR